MSNSMYNSNILYLYILLNWIYVQVICECIHFHNDANKISKYFTIMSIDIKLLYNIRIYRHYSKLIIISIRYL
jgi:hypothetical protein